MYFKNTWLESLRLPMQALKDSSYLIIHTVLPRKERHAGIEWGWPGVYQNAGISEGIEWSSFKQILIWKYKI